jgi:hypothetical protein
MVLVGSLTRVQCRIPAGERGSWARTIQTGQPVLAYVNPRDPAFYDDAGTLVSSVGRAVPVS